MNERPLRTLVTGGASGIGLFICRRFRDGGGAVVACDTNQGALDRLKESDPDIIGLRADVGNPADVAALFQEIVGRLGGLDVLVNNAGLAGPKTPIEHTPIDEWEQTLRVNLSGTFFAVRNATPLMKEQRSGCIINITTCNVRTGLTERSAYVATKAGVTGLTHNLARELGPFNIRCNSIQPGMVANPRSDAWNEARAKELGISVKEVEDDRLRMAAMRSWVQPEETAELAFFLASDSAKHITGQHISVDGFVEWLP